MDGRRIFFNDWLNVLEEMIEQNMNFSKEVFEVTQNETFEDYVTRDENLLEKIKKYQKTDEEGRLYMWLFPRELEDIMWVALENRINSK